MAIKNILVPIDFTENSLNGLSVACNVARRFNAKLHLLNAFHVPTPAVDIGGVPPSIDEFITDFKDEIQEELAKLSELVPELKGIPHDDHVHLANTIDAIYGTIEACNIDFVIMGTKKDHSGWEHLLGGLSTDVIRFAKCPVLVVPEEYSAFDPKKIALAVDYKNFDDLQKLNVVTDLAWEFNASVSIIHMGDKDEGSEQQLMEMLELSEIFDDIDYHFETIHGKKVKERLINYIDDNHIDMVVMMPRKHDLFDRIFEGSITKKVALDIQVPLLSIHE